MSGVKAAVVGLRGLILSSDERDLFLSRPPAGFILFKRNLASPAQVDALTGSLKRLFPERWVPVLIDQEGGRVQRLGPPEWPRWPPARAVARAALADPVGEARVEDLGYGIGAGLRAHGIEVNCAPVLDLERPETTAAIGDRVFSADPDAVARMGKAFARGLRAAGVAPMMKHLPGHGRARADSHLVLPRVDALRDDLASHDMRPFADLAREIDFAMTAHVLYIALDPERPATLSPTIIQGVIRNTIGFEGILLSDDLDMKALDGPVADRAALAVAAGCDLALHCSGDLEAAAAVLAAVPEMPKARFERLQDARPPTPARLPDAAVIAALADEVGALAARHA